MVALVLVSMPETELKRFRFRVDRRRPPDICDVSEVGVAVLSNISPTSDAETPGAGSPVVILGGGTNQGTSWSIEARAALAVSCPATSPDDLYPTQTV